VEIIYFHLAKNRAAALQKVTIVSKMVQNDGASLDSLLRPSRVLA